MNFGFSPNLWTYAFLSISKHSQTKISPKHNRIFIVLNTLNTPKCVCFSKILSNIAESPSNWVDYTKRANNKLDIAYHWKCLKTSFCLNEIHAQRSVPQTLSQKWQHVSLRTHHLAGRWRLHLFIQQKHWIWHVFQLIL